jgi:hypothetical protein
MDQNNGNETLTNCANNLWRQAEERVVGICENLQLQLPEEILQLLNDMQIHQIKLEMQNEELCTALENRTSGALFRPQQPWQYWVGGGGGRLN